MRKIQCHWIKTIKLIDHNEDIKYSKKLLILNVFAEDYLVLVVFCRTIPYVMEHQNQNQKWCSITKSHNFVQSLNKKYSILNRLAIIAIISNPQSLPPFSNQHIQQKKKKEERKRKRNTILTVLDDIVNKKMTFILELIHNEDQP